MILSSRGLRGLVQHLREVNESAQKDQMFLGEHQHAPITCELDLHRYHSIVMTLSLEEDLKDLIDNHSLFIKLSDFVGKMKKKLYGWRESLSEDGIQYLLELLQRMLSIERFDYEATRVMLGHCWSILQPLYQFIKQTGKIELKSEFTECLFLLRRRGSNFINETFYAGLFTTIEDKFEEFFEFFSDYLGRPEPHDYNIVQNLFKGLTIRLPRLVQDESAKNLLIQTYQNLVAFYRRLPMDSIWFRVLLRPENQIIVDSLKILTSKVNRPYDLAMVINEFVQLYLRVQLSSLQKYEFILGLFKYIIRKSPKFFAFLQSKSFSEETAFLNYFVEVELKSASCKDQISLTYMSNRFALEFLLVMMIYYLSQYPQKGNELLGLMNGLNLLQESKAFLDCEQVAMELEMFYSLAGEQSTFAELINHARDFEVASVFK